MTPEVAEALEASIAKWEANLLAKHPMGLTVGSRDCGLCRLFHWEENYKVQFHETCKACPVAQKTGRTYCAGSPYSDVMRTRSVWASAIIDDPDTEHVSARDACMEYVQAEVDFLKSLRVEAKT